MSRALKSGGDKNRHRACTCAGSSSLNGTHVPKTLTAQGGVPSAAGEKPLVPGQSRPAQEPQAFRVTPQCGVVSCRVSLLSVATTGDPVARPARNFRVMILKAPHKRDEC